MSILYNQEAFLKSYDSSRISLRESLVPLDEWMEEMFDVECEGPFSVSFKPARRLLDTPHYIAPYPKFALPMFIDVMREVSGEMEFDAVYDVWLQNLLRKCAALLMNAIPEDDMAAIDDNYDKGVILQRSTGAIIPFDYGVITGIQVSALQGVVEYCACSIRNKEAMGLGDAIALQDFLHPNVGRYHLEYGFLDPCHELIKGTSQFPGSVYIDGCDVATLTTYINDMYKTHAKVIPVI